MIFDIYRPFLDNFYIKGLIIIYDDEEVTPGFRKDVVEYIKNIDKVFVNCEFAKVIIVVVKL